MCVTQSRAWYMTNRLLSKHLCALGFRATFCLGVLLFWIVALPCVAVLCGIGTLRGWVGYIPRYPHRVCPGVLQTIEDDMLSLHLGQSRTWRRVWVDVAVAVRGVEMSLKVHCLVVGSSSKPPLVLIHGTGGSSASWFPVVRHLSRDFNVHLVDLPGFGRSDDACRSSRASRSTCDDNVDFYVTFLKAFFVATGLHVGATVLAHSYGAFLATKFAAKHPHMVSRLLLVQLAGAFCTQSACGAWISSLFSAAFPQCVHRMLGTCGVHALYTLYDMRPSSATASDPSSVYLAAQLHSSSSAHETVATFIQRDVQSSHWRDPLLPDLLALPMPVALFYGEDDFIIPAHNGAAIVAVADAAVPCYIFPGVGHSPFKGPGCASAIFASAVRDASHSAVPFGPKANRLARQLDIEDMRKFRTCYHTGEAMATILAQYAHIRSLAEPDIKVGRMVRMTCRI